MEKLYKYDYNTIVGEDLTIDRYNNFIGKEEHNPKNGQLLNPAGTRYLKFVFNEEEYISLFKDEKINVYCKVPSEPSADDEFEGSVKVRIKLDSERPPKIMVRIDKTDENGNYIDDYQELKTVKEIELLQRAEFVKADLMMGISRKNQEHHALYLNEGWFIVRDPRSPIARKHADHIADNSQSLSWANQVLSEEEEEEVEELPFN